MPETYKTISKQSEGLYKEKGSKFISYAIPVKDVDEIKLILDEYRKQYYDARHVCYAYMLGAEREEFRANDDGEPSGTAGRPILGQINSFELTDILIIVIRYFGGILLGTSGLITAYKEAAREAILQAEIVEIIVKERFSIHFGYDLMNEVLRIFKEYEPEVISSDMQYTCKFEVEIAKSKSEEFFGKLEKIYGVEISASE
ncbi:MAG TPA: YigZ family protein [Bacteroidales bacterium]|nr:YigZ family protein [Bacteroidales bacterium]